MSVRPDCSASTAACRGRRSVADHVPIPSVITLYRGPLERHWRGPAALVQGVEETLRHELAHHLGISDARLDQLHNGG